MDDKFTLHSGERQVGTRLQYIRPDHLCRYQLIVDYMQRFHAGNTSRLHGLDAFCGNGYGTFLMASELDCNVTGIDASGEAINQAHHHYSTDKTFYVTKEFPFTLPKNTYDFVASIESIEHVEQNELLLRNLVDATRSKGYMFLSAPNSLELSLKKNPNKFHFRHFSFGEFIRITRDMADITLVDFYGQNAYTMENGVVNGYLPPENMKLLKRNPRGQFLYYIFRKN